MALDEPIEEAGGVMACWSGGKKPPAAAGVDAMAGGGRVDDGVQETVVAARVSRSDARTSRLWRLLARMLSYLGRGESARFGGAWT